MFKKTLIAVAVLGATAFSVQAADVTVYGKIDTGLRYTNIDPDLPNVEDQSNFEMASGNYSGSRFGIKGQEALDNGLTIGFVLENGFKSDDGSLGSGSKLFDRQATLHLKGGFGELAAGRMGILNGTAGTFGIGNFSAMTTGWGDVGNQNALWGAGFASRYDNMITYASPEFAGFKGYAQYAFGENGKENKASTDRYAAIGATFNAGALNLIAIVDTINKASAEPAREVDDTVRGTLGGSFDFGFMKPYAAVSYFKDGTVIDLADLYKTYSAGNVGSGQYDGLGIALGADVPAFGGTFHGTLGYLDAEDQTELKLDMTRSMVGFGYEYPLSKRTTIYADAGYFKDEIDGEDSKPTVAQAAIGLCHAF